MRTYSRLSLQLSGRPAACGPCRVPMPEGASSQTLDALAKRDVEAIVIPYNKMSLNGGGIHCSTCSLIRDPID